MAWYRGKKSTQDQTPGTTRQRCERKRMHVFDEQGMGQPSWTEASGPNIFKIKWKEMGCRPERWNTRTQASSASQWVGYSRIGSSRAQGQGTALQPRPNYVVIVMLLSQFSPLKTKPNNPWPPRVLHRLSKTTQPGPAAQQMPSRQQLQTETVRKLQNTLCLAERCSSCFGILCSL